MAVPSDHPAARFPGLTPQACLHQGEHGEVWRVTDPTDQSWALKFVTTDDPAVEAGLEHEGNLHSMLKHPSVVRLRKVVQSSEGRRGLLMELIEGPSLADLIDDQGVPPLEQAIPLFEDVVRAVRSVHAQGVVHRDLKPENIVLRRRDDGTWAPTLVDFGLAKLLPTDGVSGGAAGMSLYFTTLGTPEYMAPEQAAAPSQVDERADVFSLGCLLYELLTGRVAFDAEDPDEAMAAVAAGRYVPPEQLVPLPAPLARLVRDLLAPDPDARPPHCTAILRRLDGSHLG